MIEPPAPRTRRTLTIVLERMADDPVVLLEGPRSVGKSTLLKEVTAACGGRLLDLDDPATRDAVIADPIRFVAGEQPVCIDEYQKAPLVLDAIKAELNKATRPGRFVLTGSTRHDALPPAAQALTGRLSRLTIYPFSQGELSNVHEGFLDTALRTPLAVVTGEASETTRENYISRICRGGFPLALAASSNRARKRWIDEYVRLTLERDVRELSRLRQGQLLGTLLGRLAAQTAQVLNIEKAARDVGLDRATTESYVSLLEKVFLIHRLPAWGKTLTARSAATPKIHVLDSAVAARLLRLTPEKLSTLDPTAQTEFGHLLETFAVGELLKQASWNDDVTGVGHWRTHDGDEVDLVVELDDGGVVGFEVKTGGRVPGGELRPLKKLRDAVGQNFVAGFALYLGERSYTYDDRLHVVPLDRLWSPPGMRGSTGPV
ncbi:MAG: ATP-binding protein [Acidimicrobiales bacterium]